MRNREEYFIFIWERKCRDKGPIYKHWAVGRARGRRIVQGQVNTNEGIQINGPWKKSGHKELGTLSEDKHLLDKEK